MPSDTSLKVGTVARCSGVTIRTLRYYEEIGLLSPSGRTEGGHRLYERPDLMRLQQIKSLQQLGFSLDQVRDTLQRRRFSPLRLLEVQIEGLKKQIEQQRVLCQRLEALAARLRASDEASVDEILQTIEDMTMYEKHYTPEQFEWLKQRAAQLGPERIQQVEAEWPKLIAQVRAEMEKGTDPGSPRMQALAKRWKELVLEFTGGDPGIEAAVRKVYQNEPSTSERSGIDSALSAYVEQAHQSVRGGSN